MTQSLRLVSGESGGAVARPGTPDLAARPFRPSELPRRLVVDLHDRAAAYAHQAAEEAGLPVGLWVRIAVQAARHLHAAAIVGDLDHGALAAILDDGAAACQGGPTIVEAHELYAYARSLERGGMHRAPETDTDTTVAVDVTDEIATSWAMSAAESGQYVGAWVSTLVVEAPQGAVRWEATAARAGATLGEWVYAAALRAASASSNA